MAPALLLPGLRRRRLAAALAAATGLASAALGCTELDILNAGTPYDLPFEAKAPRWADPDHHASLAWVDTAAGPKLRFTTDVPRRPACSTCDRDADGLDDRWERAVLDRTRPMIQYHRDEGLFYDPTAEVDAVGRVFPTPGGGVHVVIVIRYDRDYGRCTFTGHRGDTERVALALTPAPHAPGSLDVAAAYTAAHEGTDADHGRLVAGADLAELVFTTDRVTGDARWRVFASEGKHASYMTPADCNGFGDLPCIAEGCPGLVEDVERTLLVPVFNAGEPGQVDAIEPEPGVDVAPRWSDQDPWSGEPFCGFELGNQGGCARSVRDKLVDDPVLGY